TPAAPARGTAPPWCTEPSAGAPPGGARASRPSGRTSRTRYDRSVRRRAAVKHSVKHVRRSMSSAESAAIRRRTHDGEERQMPLFIDVHNIEGGVSAADVAGAHEADLATQGAHGVNYLRVWVDEEAGKIFEISR